MINAQAQHFYDNQFAGQEYATPSRADQHPYFAIVKSFVEEYGLSTQRCLEVGCGRGVFQDLVEDYTGIDLSTQVSSYFHKPFVSGDATDLPFADSTFDAIWSVTVLEHVPQPQLALNEICRVVRPGGVVLMAPAWHTRPWFADGYPVRSFRELSFKGKLVKLSIPVRDFFLYRHTKTMLRRSLRLIKYSVRHVPIRLAYTRLRPNYERFWMSDSDACNSLDPFDFILWFESRGHTCLSHPTKVCQLLVNDLCLLFQVNRSGSELRLQESPRYGSQR